VIVKEIPLERIIVKKNIRLEADNELGGLMESIERHELLQPVVVFKRGDRYELICGHRRLEAMKLRGEPTIAASILENVSESEIPLIKLQENLQRKQLTSEEIVGAADEIQRQHPGFTDLAVDKMLGKHEGYLSLHRSTVRGVSFLAKQGIPKAQLASMPGEEVRDMCAKIRAGEKGPVKREHTYHGRDGLPKKGFRVYTQSGPAIMVVCSSKKIKRHVFAELKKMQKECAS
jgi:hypothetical protein